MNKITHPFLYKGKIHINSSDLFINERIFFTISILLISLLAEILYESPDFPFIKISKIALQ